LLKECRIGPIWFIPGKNGGKYPFCHSLYIEGAGILIDPASDRERLIQLRQEPGVRMVWLSHWHEDHWMHLDLFKSRKATKFFQGGQIIDLGMVTVEVIYTPGHTPGHLAFFFREPKVLFIGDYDLTRFGPWYGDTHSSIEETIESVNRLKRIPAEVFLTSHETGVFTGDPGKLWDDYLEVIYDRERRLLDFLIKPKTIEEIVGAWIVYGRQREPKAFFEFGERALMKKHLDRLMRSGRVYQEGDRYIKRTARQSGFAHVPDRK
jgi:hydroxyacylglutathione hydrolase